MEFTDTEARAVSRVSKSLARRFHGYATQQEISQELYAWMLEYPHKVEEWRELDHGPAMLTTALRRTGRRFGTREKCKTLGTQPGDFYRYSPREIEGLIKEALDYSGWELASEGKLVVLIDVKSAYESLPLSQQSVLYDLLIAEDDKLTVANRHGITTSALDKRVRRATKRMRNFLNEGPFWSQF